LYKPAAALVYATAFTLTGEGMTGSGDSSGLVTVLSGLMLMLLAVLTLPALLRFGCWCDRWWRWWRGCGDGCCRCAPDGSGHDRSRLSWGCWRRCCRRAVRLEFVFGVAGSGRCWGRFLAWWPGWGFIECATWCGPVRWAWWWCEWRPGWLWSRWRCERGFIVWRHGRTEHRPRGVAAWHAGRGADAGGCSCRAGGCGRDWCGGGCGWCPGALVDSDRSSGHGHGGWSQW
jgi:hypothetical protein